MKKNRFYTLFLFAAVLLCCNPRSAITQISNPPSAQADDPGTGTDPRPIDPKQPKDVSTGGVNYLFLLNLILGMA